MNSIYICISYCRYWSELQTVAMRNEKDWNVSVDKVYQRGYPQTLKFVFIIFWHTRVHITYVCIIMQTLPVSQSN